MQIDQAPAGTPKENLAFGTHLKKLLIQSQVFVRLISKIRKAFASCQKVIFAHQDVDIIKRSAGNIAVNELRQRWPFECQTVDPSMLQLDDNSYQLAGQEK